MNMKENIPESPEKGKPFLTEEDAELAGREAYGYWDDLNPQETEYRRTYQEGYNAAASKANKRIEELGKEIADAKFWADEQSKGLNHYADEMSSLRAELSKANNTILIMTEDRDQFAIEFAKWIGDNDYSKSAFSDNWVDDKGHVNTLKELLEQFKSTRK